MSLKRQIRINIDELDTFDALKAGNIFSDTQLASAIMAAALVAIKTNGGTIKLPLKFQVAETGEKAVSPKRKAA